MDRCRQMQTDADRCRGIFMHLFTSVYLCLGSVSWFKILCVLDGVMAFVHANLHGFSCSVSTKILTGKRTLRVNDVIFWNHDSAAMILFFPDYKDASVMVLKDLHELSYDVPHGKKISLQSTQALCLDDAINLTCPTWWTIEDRNVICLL